MRLLRFSVFTFHNVPIKTASITRITAAFSKFTFHNVPIKTLMNLNGFQKDSNLHSTMYLLKRRSSRLCFSIFLYLHSTMYLLKQKYQEEKETSE